MKKLSIIVIAVSICTLAFAKKVKFAVDMGTEIINPFGIHVTGDFQAAAGYPADWEAGTTPMTQVGSSNIYEIVVDIPAFRKYEYKFVNGEMGYEVEFVPEKSRVGYNFIDNRWLYVDSLANDTTYIGAMVFGGNAPAGKKMMRFVLSMVNIWTINPTGVHVAGDFQNWNYQTNYISSLDSLQPYLYDVIVFGDSNTSYQYKFANGNTVADTESVAGTCTVNGNRTLTLITDTVMSTVCFNSCSDCLATGIASTVKSKSFSIYPNPANETSTIVFDKAIATKTIRIFDAYGNLVKLISNNNSSQINLDRNNLVDGFYTIQVITADGKSQSQRWMLAD